VSLLSVIQDVCATVGVERPASVFAGINANRTMAEMLACANEMAQRIAYDTREWTQLRNAVRVGEESEGIVALPADFKRFLVTTNLRRSSAPTLPMRFIADLDEWAARRARQISDPRGEWIINVGKIFVIPRLALHLSAAWKNSTPYQIGNLAVDTAAQTVWQVAVVHTSAASPTTFASDRTAHPTFWTSPAQTIDADTVHFTYLSKYCVSLVSTGLGDFFMNDGDTFRLDERLLKLGMIWSWKQLKGSPYAEDMANFQDALSRVAGADKPAPIIVGRMPVSSSMAVSPSYPFPV
jgi:hypothetical protein